MQRILVSIPLSLALVVGLSACDSSDGAEPQDAALATDASSPQFVATSPGTVAIEGDPSGEIVAGPQAVTLRLDGVEDALVYTLVDGQLQPSWGGEVVDPEGELPEAAELAISLAERAFADELLASHMSNSGIGLWPGVVGPGPVNPCGVSGCNAEICAAEPVVSTCGIRPEFECLEFTTCGEFGPDNSCAWERTPAYTACLEAVGAGESVSDSSYATETEVEGLGKTCGCEVDADCVKAVPGCCPCNSGGEEVAIAKACIDKLPGCDLDPSQIICKTVDLCTNREAVCKAGECVLTEESSAF